MAPPAPPGGGKTPWSRVAPRLAFAWLLVWALAWGIAGIAGESAGAVALLWVHVGFGGFGFAGHLVVGLGFRLDATFNQRPLAPLWMQRVIPVLLSLTALLVGMVHHPLWGGDRQTATQVAAWSLAAATVLIAVAAARQSASAPGTGQDRYAATDRSATLLAPVIVAYAVAAGLLAIARGILDPAVIHLWLVGFVTTTVFAVSHRILPRFSHMPERRRLHRAQAVLAVPGPALLAWGIAKADHAWAWVGASIEFVAAVLYTVLVALAWWHRRSRQPALPIMFLGALLLLNGMVFGLAFLAHPWLRVHLALHVVNNLVGFLAITILGAGSAMLGVGVRAVPGSVNRNVWLLAGALAAPLILWEVLFVLGSPGQAVLWVTVAAMGAHGALGIRALAAA